MAKQSLADYPRIVDFWHPYKNDGRQPENYTHGCSNKVWLQCHGCTKCGEVHQWAANANNLTRVGKDVICPSCASRKSFCSCRAVSSDKYLAAQWHEDNPSPATIALGSAKKFKWRCSDAACGHVWDAQPRNRSSGTECTECASRKLPSLAHGRPDLAAEWDAEKNEFLATEVSCGSHKKGWWLCKLCGGSWQAAVGHRALKGSSCPTARCQKIKKDARMFSRIFGHQH
jgi:hypothetical protein